MRSLLSKILLSLVISVVIALLVVVLITRTSLHRGMVDYIDRQESGQLEKLAPELSELYQQQGDWSFLRGHPWRWKQLLRLTRPLPGKAGETIEDRRRRAFVAGAMRPPGHDRLNLRNRLFLLRSAERRGGQECRYRLSPHHVKKKQRARQVRHAHFCIGRTLTSGLARLGLEAC